MGSVGDWDEIIDEAEAERFVGRENELELFRQQVRLDKPRYLIFYITGQGGSGKTTLLNRYQDIARGFNFLITDCDEKQRDVPAVLGRFAQQLAEQGFSLKHFDEHYKTYRQKLHEIENDPEAPQGLAAMLGRMVVRAAYIGGDLVPGLRQGLEFLPRESVEAQASEWTTYLAKKLSNKDDIALIKEPVSILTPLFFEDLKVLQRRKALLCFDNFEATRIELQEWLVRLPEYKPSQNIRIVIAGRDQPGAKWDSLRSVTKAVPIDVFTDQEAEAFLDTYSITNLKRRKEILKLSGKLPVLMSWLAATESQVQDADPSVPTHDIVERFLRWVTHPILKQVALLASIPRIFNMDILKLLLEKRIQESDEQSAFDWLQTLPFIYQRPNGWQYHDVVRRMMLQYQRQKSPHTFRQLHTLLANFYDKCCSEFAFSEQWTNEEWCLNSLANIYHLLFSDPHKHWGEVISLFIIAVRKHRTFAVEIIETLSSGDVYDELAHEQFATINLFRQQLRAIKEGKLQDGFEMFNKLCDMANLSSQAKGYAFAYRGECHLLNKDWEKALQDFENALQHISDDAWIYSRRGETYLLMRQYQEALKDLDRAIALDEKDTQSQHHRSFIYGQMGYYEEALVESNWATELSDPKSKTAANQNITYRVLRHYQPDLAELNFTINLGKGDALTFTNRGMKYRQFKRYQDALIDFNQAIKLDEQFVFAIAGRGETYLVMGQYSKALADFNRAIFLDQQSDWYLYCRTQVYLLTGQTDALKRDIDAAIELAQTHLLISQDDLHLQFNLALYNLIAGYKLNAESQYSHIASACSSIAKLQDAIDDIFDFLTLQPSNEFAQNIRTQLQTRIEDLKLLPV